MNPSRIHSLSILAFIIGERLLSLAPLIHAGVALDQPILKSAFIAGSQALAGVLGVLITRFQSHYLTESPLRLSLICSIFSIFLASFHSHFGLSLVFILGREIASCILLANLLGNMGPRLGMNAAESAKKIQQFKAIGILAGFALAPYALEVLGYSLLFVLDSITKCLISVGFYAVYLHSNPCPAPEESENSDCPNASSKGFLSGFPSHVKGIWILILLMGTGVGVVNILEVPHLVQTLALPPEGLAFVIAAVLLSYGLGYLVTAYAFSFYKWYVDDFILLLLGSLGLCGFALGFLLASHSALFCLSFLGFGVSNCLFNLGYSVRFQSATSSKATSFCHLMADIILKIGLFLSSILVVLEREIDFYLIFLPLIGGISIIMILYLYQDFYKQQKSYQATSILGLILILGSFIPHESMASDQSSLHILSHSNHDIIDPAQTKLISWGTIYYQVFDSLYEYSDKNTLRPSLVERHTISAQGKKILLVIKNGVTFSDGAELNASTVAQSLIRTIRLMKSSVRWALGDVEGFEEFINTGDAQKIGIRALSPREVEISLVKPFPFLLQTLTAPNFLITKQDQFGQWIGTGTYRVDQIDKSKITLLARSDLTQAKSLSPKKLVFFLEDPTLSRLEQVKRDHIDLLLIPSKDEALPPTYSVHRYDYIRSMFVMLNTRKGQFVDAQKRCAFTTKLESTLDDSGYSWKKVIYGFPFSWDLFPPKSKVSQKEIRQHLSTPLSPVEILFSNSMTVQFDDQANRKISKMMKGYNTPLRFVQLPLNALIARIQKGDFQAIMLGYVPDYLDPDAILYPFLGTNQLYNLSHYSNETVDTLLNLAREMSSPSERNLVYKSLFGILNKDCPVHFLGSEDGYYASSNRWIFPKLSGLGFYGVKLRNTLRMESLNQ